METRSYIFIEEQYTALPIPQEFLNKRGTEITPLVTGQDEEGNDIVEERTPLNTSILAAIANYSQTKEVNGKSPVSRFWFNGIDVPTKLQKGQSTLIEMVEVDGAEVEQEVLGGKVFWLIPIPNFSIAEVNAMIKATQGLSITNFPIVLAHDESLDFIRKGILPIVDLS